MKNLVLTTFSDFFPFIPEYTGVLDLEFIPKLLSETGLKKKKNYLNILNILFEQNYISGGVLFCFVVFGFSFSGRNCYPGQIQHNSRVPRDFTGYL